MKAALLPVIAVVLLAGCLQSSQPVPEVTRQVAPGFLLLVRFATGADEPPAGGVIRACPQAASGLCVVEVERFLLPLEALGDGWRYADSAGNLVTLRPDGTGRMAYVGGDGVAVTWTTEAWHN